MAYISSDALQELAAGSYEHVICAVERAVHEKSRTLFGKDSRVEVVATFPGSAVVLSEDGELARVHFDRSASSPHEVSIVRHEMLPAPVFEDARDFARAEVRSAINAWRAGRIEEARDRLAKAAPYVPERLLAEDKVVEKIIEDLNAPRAWKQLLEGGLDTIQKTVGRVTSETLQASCPKPKFELLYSGTLTEAKVRSYEALVRAGLRSLADRFQSLREATSAAYERAQLVIKKLPPEQVVSSLVVFAEDLLLDLSRLNQVLVESKSLSDVGLLGRLHDSVAGVAASYELGGKFVAVVAEKLGEKNA